MQYFTNEDGKAKILGPLIGASRKCKYRQIHTRSRNFFQNPHLKNIEKRLENRFCTISDNYRIMR